MCDYRDVIGKGVLIRRLRRVSISGEGHSKARRWAVTYAPYIGSVQIGETCMRKWEIWMVKRF